MRYNTTESAANIINLISLLLVFVSIVFPTTLFAEDTPISQDDSPSFIDLFLTKNEFLGHVIDVNTKEPLPHATVVITGTHTKVRFRHLDIICEGVELATSNHQGVFKGIHYGYFGEDVRATTYLPGYEYLKVKVSLGGLPYISPVTIMRDDNIDHDNVTLLMTKSTNDKQDRLLYLYDLIKTINYDECNNEPNLISINETILVEAKSLIQSNYDRFIYHNMELEFFKRISKKNLEELKHEIYLEDQRIRRSEHIRIIESADEHEIISYLNRLSYSMSRSEFILLISLERNTEHQTPLMIASRRGQENVVRLLLSFGVNPNSINRDTSGSDPEDALLIALYAYQNATRRGDDSSVNYRHIINDILLSKEYRLTPFIAKRLKDMSFDPEHVPLHDGISNRHYKELSAVTQ